MGCLLTPWTPDAGAYRLNWEMRVQIEAVPVIHLFIRYV